MLNSDRSANSVDSCLPLNVPISEMEKCWDVRVEVISAEWNAKATFGVALLHAIYDIGVLHNHTF